MGFAAEVATEYTSLSSSSRYILLCSLYSIEAGGTCSADPRMINEALFEPSQKKKTDREQKFYGC